jgi:hypothetical protein
MGKWVYRTNQDYNETISQEKKSLNGPAWLAVFCALMFVVFTFTDGAGFTRRSSALNNIHIDYLGITIETILFGLLVFGIGVILRPLANRFLRNIKGNAITVICDNCYQTKNQDHIAKCICGGNYVDIRRMEWVDDDPEVQAPTTDSN